MLQNPVAELNLSRLILGFGGNIEYVDLMAESVCCCVRSNWKYYESLTVTSAGSQTLDKLTFRTPTASSGVGNLYYVIAGYPNGFTGGTNSSLTIKQTDISAAVLEQVIIN